MSKVPDFGDHFMSNTLTALLAFADDFEKRANHFADPMKQAELIDMAVRSRYLTSELAKVFEFAKKMKRA